MKDNNNTDNQISGSQKFQPINMSKDQEAQFTATTKANLQAMKEEIKGNMDHDPDCKCQKSVQILDASIDIMGDLQKPASQQNFIENVTKLVSASKEMIEGKHKSEDDDEDDDDFQDEDDDMTQVQKDLQALNVEILNKTLAHLQNFQTIPSQIQKQAVNFKFILQNIVHINSLNQGLMLYEYLVNSSIQLLLNNLMNFGTKIEKWLEVSFENADMTLVENLNQILDVFKEAQDVSNTSIPNLAKFTNEHINFNVQLMNSMGDPSLGGPQFQLPNEQEKLERIKTIQQTELQTLTNILMKLSCLPQIDLEIENEILKPNEQQQPQPQIENPEVNDKE